MSVPPMRRFLRTAEEAMELELHLGVSCLRLVLGTKLKNSAITASTILKYGAISLATEE